MNRRRTGAHKSATTKKKSNEPNRPWEKEPIPTAGERLPDGSIIELVRDSSDATKAALLHHDGSSVFIGDRIYGSDNNVFVPAIADPVVLRQLRLPTKDLPYGSTPELVNKVSSILVETLELAADNAFLGAVFSVASSFSDCLLTQICLWLLGSARTEAMALLRVLSWFCWHPLLLADDACIDCVPENLTATRLFYAPRPSSKLRKLILNLRAPGFGVFRRGSLLESRPGAIVIYFGPTDPEGVCDDSCLRIPVAPATRLLRPGDEERFNAPVEEIRAQLLNYRLVNYEKVRRSEFDVADFTGPTRELTRALGACLIDAPDVQERLIALLREQDESVRLERSAEMSPTLESLIALCHERRSSVYVGEITKGGNDILSARGEAVTLSPKEVGHKLRLLGLHTTRLDAGGRGLKLRRAVCARIHQLAKDFGVPAALEKGLPGCPDCKQIFNQQSNSALGARSAHHAHRARETRGTKINEAQPA